MDDQVTQNSECRTVPPKSALQWMLDNEFFSLVKFYIFLQGESADEGNKNVKNYIFCMSLDVNEINFKIPSHTIYHPTMYLTQGPLFLILCDSRYNQSALYLAISYILSESFRFPTMSADSSHPKLFPDCQLLQCFWIKSSLYWNSWFIPLGDYVILEIIFVLFCWLSRSVHYGYFMGRTSYTRDCPVLSYNLVLSQRWRSLLGYGHCKLQMQRKAVPVILLCIALSCSSVPLQ